MSSPYCSQILEVLVIVNRCVSSDISFFRHWGKSCPKFNKEEIDFVVLGLHVIEENLFADMYQSKDFHCGFLNSRWICWANTKAAVLVLEDFLCFCIGFGLLLLGVVVIGGCCVFFGGWLCCLIWFCWVFSPQKAQFRKCLFVSSVMHGCFSPLDCL